MIIRTNEEIAEQFFDEKGIVYVDTPELLKLMELSRKEGFKEGENSESNISFEDGYKQATAKFEKIGNIAISDDDLKKRGYVKISDLLKKVQGLKILKIRMNHTEDFAYMEALEKVEELLK